MGDRTDKDGVDEETDVDDSGTFSWCYVVMFQDSRAVETTGRGEAPPNGRTEGKYFKEVLFEHCSKSRTVC
jgi:hypothetical protein